MFQRILQNHVLANLLFVLVMLMGISSYLLMPREQDPTINFNWIDITTIYPGASTPDVENEVSNVLEDAIRNVSDIKFVSSSSRDSVSSLLIRFDEISTRTFEKRLADLRREVEGVKDQLPDDASGPFIFEITTSNAFPTATVVISAISDDQNLRRQAALLKQDIERIKGVGRVLDNGLAAPEIHIEFDPATLEQFGLSPNQIADTVQLYFRNVSAGTVDVSQTNWSIKVTGNQYDLERLGNIPILTTGRNVTLKEVANIYEATEPKRELVRFHGKPSVLFAVTKQDKQNILELVEHISEFIEQRQPAYESLGVSVTLVDDQTQITKDALRVMQTNALLGLLFVVVATWFFLDTKMALLTGIAIPFILAGTFWFLSSINQTINVSVLLGVVISLGMLVDDAVVVVESIYYRLQRGADVLKATVEGLAEVITPVSTAVLTTIAAFLPLMLLPGILGKFMLIIPLVVTVALLISLVEAFWLLPAHIAAFNVNFSKPSRIHRTRERFQRWIRLNYGKLIIRVLKHPFIAIIVLLVVFGGTINLVATGKIKFDFFASDPIRLFYVNVKMPSGTEVRKTMDKVLEVENTINKHIKPGEIRSVVSYSGQMLTQTELFFGEQYGQILISLNPKTRELRSVDEMIEAMNSDVMSTTGIEQISFLRLSGGPPVTKAITVKVRGNEYQQIHAASAEIKQFMQESGEFLEVADDNLPGQNTLDLTLNGDAIQRTGILPNDISRTLRLLVNGEIVTSFRHQGESIDIRVKSSNKLQQIDDLLDHRILLPNGESTPLNQLVDARKTQSASTIRHYNYRRTITVESDIDTSKTDTIAANQKIKDYWKTIQHKYPNVDLDFSGVLDDIEESLSAIGMLFLMGLGLIYLILGTQFKSYFQPFLIIMTVPMAATGVVLGLFIGQYPLSLYTLYGVVALAGIAVNAAIVLISTANKRLGNQYNVTSAIVQAARRRVIPILITSITTIAGLFSLATGLGGHSLLWGPMATSMVWGVAVSTALTLFYVPLFYRLFMKPWRKPTTRVKTTTPKEISA
ncbi:MAG: AcrB/AcrD/AcrF family protein [Gammaproteobacteria bacterium]|nr:AcrB/AcrD/AcrF family protein [Gammaproteobacteria bacterium]